MNKKTTSDSTKEAKFSNLFDRHYKRLYNYALKVLKETELSEELVQETFIKLWENFEHINQSERSIESFLITTLKNKIIDAYRKKQTREKHTNIYALNTSVETQIDKQWELIERIEDIYTTLEKKTTDIFKLSRDKGLTYKEISKKKDISIKTVELHISKALTAFKKGLKDYF
ncbi:RNA polymerase sigma-70 factor, ECF subfamily [Aquimarina amphilecti]|uniref:RNA polymerase sigma-70 factor, ECF subfamily n=1 Tax=Aquimarina amphilecti TaxID=1038014 RepID=A0A1H7S5T6_AQUAM|nr:sigma-70 family RNA polymerase sigma factor [Aquimarina amphilecti]SEL67606.1 RNA polymerase sigma-70 factor, ECF subfamily [Aquimarina amphilecti]